MSIEIKKNIISEASEEGIQETKTKKIEIESSSTIDVKKLEVTFKTKEEELKKWQNELENKANELEMKAIEILKKKIEIESISTIDIEKLGVTFKTKEEELKKWQNELENKANELEMKAIEIDQKSLELDERQKNAEEALKQKINLEYNEAKFKLSDEQANIRAEFMGELDKKRREFEKKREESILELDKEIENARLNLRKELDTLRKNHEKELKTEYDEQKEKLKKDREEALEKLKKEIKERTAELDIAESICKSTKEKVDKEKGILLTFEEDLKRREEDLVDQKENLKREKKRLEREKIRIEEADNNLQEVVNQKIEDTIKNLNQKIEIKDTELNNLREQLATTNGEIELIKSFRESYGDDPQVLRQNIKELQDINKNLRDKLSNSSNKNDYDLLFDRYKDADAKNKKLLKENEYLNNSQEGVDLLEAQYSNLNSKYNSLLSTCESLKNQLEAKNEELIRLSAPEGRLADRDARIASIMTGALDDKKDLVGAGEGLDSRYKSKDEILWLENVWKKCQEYGIKFNKRILYAFHTALKINEWSTITVLAGVSGTGKSELPRLYSEFGGLNFCSVAVQPNWDSQESMLGFFNSIDNQFEPEELLKFLVQCTTDSRYKEYMSVILLDEMNLAHVEHYFAEFLSKLETRRGLSRNYLPEIEVKLGAGVKPYGLKLARTLLWTGTMNQDETTKSLSDKVLDRGIIINFPRPKTLESRAKMGLITDYISDERAKLHKDTWQSWTSHVIEFSEEQKKEIDNFREIVEKINNFLEEVGRALGHRVWQSIEYYIANYPTVRKAMNYQPKQNEKGKIVWFPTNSELTGELKKAMRIAFEDQIVQKIMPKLRGIETRDKKGKSSLDKIEDLLVTNDFTNLQEDFEIAREQGYGQFIWNSAKYLDKEDEKELGDESSAKE